MAMAVTMPLSWLPTGSVTGLGPIGIHTVPLRLMTSAPRRACFWLASAAAGSSHRREEPLGPLQGRLAQSRPIRATGATASERAHKPALSEGRFPPTGAPGIDDMPLFPFHTRYRVAVCDTRARLSRARVSHARASRVRDFPAHVYSWSLRLFGKQRDIS